MYNAVNDLKQLWKTSLYITEWVQDLSSVTVPVFELVLLVPVAVIRGPLLRSLLCWIWSGLELLSLSGPRPQFLSVQMRAEVLPAGDALSVRPLEGRQIIQRCNSHTTICLTLREQTHYPGITASGAYAEAWSYTRTEQKRLHYSSSFWPKKNKYEQLLFNSVVCAAHSNKDISLHKWVTSNELN